MTEIEVSRFVVGSPKAYKQLLLRMEHFYKWWPIDTKYQGNNTISIKPILAMPIMLKKIESDKKSVIEYRYINGPLRGVGRWIFQNLGSEEYFRLSYYMQVRGFTPGISLLSKTPLFKQIHRENLDKIIRAAEVQINKHKGDAL